MLNKNLDIYIKTAPPIHTMNATTIDLIYESLKMLNDDPTTLDMQRPPTPTLDDTVTTDDQLHANPGSVGLTEDESGNYYTMIPPPTGLLPDNFMTDPTSGEDICGSEINYLPLFDEIESDDDESSDAFNMFNRLCNGRKDLPDEVFLKRENNPIPYEVAINVFKHIDNVHDGDVCPIHPNVSWDDIIAECNKTLEERLVVMSEVPSEGDEAPVNCTSLQVMMSACMCHIPPNVIDVRVMFDEVTDNMVYGLVEGNPHLERLEINNASLLTNKSLKKIASKLRFLKHLVIFDYGQLNDRGLSRLSETSVETLCIAGCYSVSKKYVKRLVECHPTLCCAYVSCNKEKEGRDSHKS